MPSKTKITKTTTNTTNSTVVPKKTLASSSTKKVLKKVSSSSEKPKKVVSKPAAVAAAPVSPVETPTKPNMEKLLETFNDNLVAAQKGLSQLAKDYKIITKMYSRERAAAEKLEKKRSGNRRSSDAKPSGFAKPGYISPELCNFLGKPFGTEMARTDVTRYLTTYIKEKGLQNKENRKQIICDAALQGLLKPQKNDVITYFNLQSYMKRHYDNPTSNGLTASA